MAARTGMKYIHFQDLIEEFSSPKLIAGDPFVMILLVILGIFLYLVMGLFAGIVWLINNYPRFTIPPLVSTVAASILSWILTGEVQVIIKVSIGGGIIGAIIGAILEFFGEYY